MEPGYQGKPVVGGGFTQRRKKLKPNLQQTWPASLLLWPESRGSAFLSEWTPRSAMSGLVSRLI